MKLLKLKTFSLLPHFLFFFFFNSFVLPQAIKLSEIMFNPVGSNNEFIEIVNTSDNQIDLSGYKILYNTSLPADEIISPDSNYILNPQQYAVILEGDYDFNNGIYKSIIPDTAPVFTIDDNSFGRNGMANSSNRTIYLINADNDTVDSHTYTADNEEGISDERIDLTEDDWQNSLVQNGTPGKRNSVAQKEKDLSITKITTHPEFPLLNDTVSFSAQIKNTGKETLDFNIRLFANNNNGTKDSLLETSPLLVLASADSLTYNFSFTDTVKQKEQNYIFELNVNDNDTTNNKTIYTLIAGYPPKSIIISEIMFLPKNDEPEWIELYNNSEYNINISGWQIGDVFSKPVFKTITEDKFTFKAKSYLVLTKSNSIYNYYRNITSPVMEIKFANLNNDIDGVVLKDNRSAIIDSVLYTKDFNRTNGKSIEKVNLNFDANNPNNWQPSSDIENGTPGRINSVTPKNYDLAITNIKPVPFNPVKNSNIKIKTKIKNRGKLTANDFTLNLYYQIFNRYEKIETIEHLSLGAGDSLTITSSKEIFIKDTIKISAEVSFEQDEDKINNVLEKRITSGFNKNTVLINEIMFNPKYNEPQWIEIINNTDTTVNIRNWNIGNSKQKNIITEENILIAPHNLAVITSFDNGNYFPNDGIIIKVALPYFNKRKDDVIIYDYRNAAIDSTEYEIPNNMPQGISLERIDLNLSSTDKNNWIFSLDSSGGTPGKKNSVYNLPQNTFGGIVVNEIMYDPDSTNCEFIELFNNSANPLQIGGWKIEDINKKYFYVSQTSKLLMPNEYFIVAADSSIFNNYTWLNDYNNISVKNSPSLLLKNNGKLLYLKDFRNKTIDSIYYKNNWHNPNILNTKNISLELINPNIGRNKKSNWSSSVSKEGATPGKQNSVFTKRIKNKSKLNISPNPFSPDNDGFEDFTLITYKLTQPVAQIRIRIFDAKGRLVRTLADNIPAGSEGTIIFNGLNDNGNPLKPGIYIVFLEAVNFRNNISETIKAAIVIAQKL